MAVGVEENVSICVENELGFVIEVELGDFVVQSEGNRLIRFCPSFYVDERKSLLFVFCQLSCTSMEVFPEVLHEGQFLTDFFVIWAAGNIKRCKFSCLLTVIADIVDFSEYMGKYSPWSSKTILEESLK